MPLAKLLSRVTFLLLFCSVFNGAFAQGSWQPAGADLSFPRTLLKASEIPAVQQSLTQPDRQQLYTSVYGWAMAPPPATNTSDTDRRMRARSAKNQAFVLLMDRKPAGNTLETLTEAEKAQLETNAISLLNSLNTQVAWAFNYTSWQWRSKELIDYLCAYDLLRGAGVPESSLLTAKTSLQNFAGNLYSNGSGNVGSINNNHMFMTAAALGMAGIVLNDMGSTTASKQPQNWINIGMFNIDNVMWHKAERQSQPGVIAGYAEGPYYFKYAMENCLPFFRAFGNFLPDGNYSFTWGTSTRLIRNPFHDPNYDLLYQWMTDITMPDGRFPALEDSYTDMGMPELALTGKPQYVQPFYGQNLQGTPLNSLNAQLDGTVDLRANYLAANVQPQAQSVKPLLANPVAGNLVFRSGSGFTGNYLHVYGKNGLALTNSGGHNQGDASSFTLYAHGQLLALDAGYLNYSRRAEVGNATNHNLILVDGTGPQIGTTGSANDAEAFIENTFTTPNLSYGEVRTAYSGAGITRKTISVRGQYYLMADFITAAAPHNYTWQLHGSGLENGTATQGTFTDNTAGHEGTWQNNGVSLKAHVTATGGASSYTKNTGIHETTWNTTQNHTTLLVNKNNVTETQFLAALDPFIAAPNTSTVTLALPGMAGLLSATAGYTDLTFSKADTLLQTVNTAALQQPVSSDANLTFYSLDNNQELSQAFLQNGTTLLYGTEQLIKSDRRANLVWAQPATGQFEGYVSKPATLLVKVTRQPVSVSGQNLSSWTYDAATSVLTATFSQPSDFQYKVSQNPLPVELLAFSAKKVNRQVQLNWQTASEKNNRQFLVQRSANGHNWETIATKAGQGTTNIATSYNHIDTPHFSGRLYYRLQQEDLDGTVSFSAVKVVTLEKPAAKLAVYPNPASDKLFLELETPQTGTAEINIMNAAGSRLYTQQHTFQNGRNSLELNLPQLPAGFYIVSLQTSSGNQQAKFLKR